MISIFCIKLFEFLSLSNYSAICRIHNHLIKKVDLDNTYLCKNVSLDI